MAFVDAVLIPVPAGNKTIYVEHSRKMAALFRKHGALEVVECWGVEIPDGAVNSMKSAVHLQDGEQVVLGWVVWPSKQVRDNGMTAAMKDWEGGGASMPFDGKRLIHGGFERVLHE